MRITRRTSGGRGEYEISETTASGLRPSDLHDRRLILDFGDNWIIDTSTRLILQAGKHRIRMMSSSAGSIHIHRQLAAALMMPRPVREDVNLAGGLPVLRAERYAIEHIQMSDVVLEGEAARLIIGEVVLRNTSYHAQNLNFRDRVSRVQLLWAETGRLPDSLRGLVLQHRSLAEGGHALTTSAEVTVEQLQTLVTDLAEDLSLVYRSADVDVLPDLLQAVQASENPPEPPMRVDQIDPDETQVRRRVASEWKRWANSRGSASAIFRQRVRTAYASRCIVCGICLPATAINAVPGVDAAHILPWADYDLDVISNGLCLCRVHHWAFDEGLIVIRTEHGEYFLEIPEDVVAAISAQAPQFSLEQLQLHVGLIPQTRLPVDPLERPNPIYLEMLRQSQ